MVGMKILLLTHFFPPGHLGGTEVLSFGLAKSLVAAGHTVQVICGESWATAPSYQIRATHEIYDTVPVIRLHFNWMKAPHVFQYLYNNPEVYRYITDFLKDFKPDIVHITSCYTLSASIVDAVTDLGFKSVFSATDFWFLCARNTLLRTDQSLCNVPENPWECAQCLMDGARAYRLPKKILPGSATLKLLKGISAYPLITNQRGFRGMLGDWEDRFRYLARMLRKVDLIVTASNFLKNKFINFGIPAEKIIYSSYGLDTTWSVGYETKTPASHLRLGFIGQLIPIKGPDLLIKAVHSLPAELPVQLKIYGDLMKMPEYGEELQLLAQGDPRIEFRGTFENSKMGTVLQDIDVLVVPSIWYDFPLVIPSAFATKTPVIATNLPGMNELIENNVTGLLFERADLRGMTDSILKLVHKPELLAQMRSQIQPVKTIKELADEYLAYYALVENPI